MKVEFVTYNQALALKELGFDEPCLMYIDDEEDLINDDTAEWIGAVKAPLKQQVFRWFREKHNLISCIRTISYGCTIDEQEFYCEIVSVRGVSSYSLHNKFEEAESECIDKLIEIVKNK